MGPPGLEPGTSSLSATRSSQLSYEPAHPGNRPGQPAVPSNGKTSCPRRASLGVNECSPENVNVNIVAIHLQRIIWSFSFVDSQVSAALVLRYGIPEPDGLGPRPVEQVDEAVDIPRPGAARMIGALADGRIIDAERLTGVYDPARRLQSGHRSLGEGSQRRVRARGFDAQPIAPRARGKREANM